LSAQGGVAIGGRAGQVLTSGGSRTAFRLSADQRNTLRTRDALAGEPFWDAGLGKAAIVLVVPIRQDDGMFLGALGAKINLDGVRDMLAELSVDRARSLYLVTEPGRVVVSSAGNSADLDRKSVV